MATGAAVLAASSGLLVPGQVLAAYNQAAFDAKDVPSAIKGALGSDAAEASDKIKIKAPDIAENGAVVPVSASTTIADVTSIALLVEKNGKVEIGAPLVKGAKVIGKVVEQGRGEKVVVFKYKPKKRYKVKKGHRQPYGEVEIVKIQ